jgi:hypothetical protein
MTLKQIFSALWVWISVHKEPDELKNRTIEELVEMKGYCSTGHLARTINIMQGFTDDPNLTITISSADQVEAVVSTFITKEIQKDENEAASDALIMQRYLHIFYNFVVKIINEKMAEWLKEYGPVHDHILNAVIKYTQQNGFKMEEGKLVAPTDQHQLSI